MQRVESRELGTLMASRIVLPGVASRALLSEGMLMQADEYFEEGRRGPLLTARQIVYESLWIKDDPSDYRSVPFHKPTARLLLALLPGLLLPGLQNGGGGKGWAE